MCGSVIPVLSQRHREEKKLFKLRNSGKGDSNPGSLDLESSILSHRAHGLSVTTETTV